MNSINIIGRMVRDPEVRYTPSGVAVCSFSIACDDGTKDKPHCSFFDVTAWQRTAEIIVEYVSKGHQIAVNGRLEQQTWNDKTSGDKRSKVQIVANNVTLLNNRKDSADQSPRHDSGAESQSEPVSHNGFDGSHETPLSDSVPF